MPINPVAPEVTPENAINFSQGLPRSHAFESLFSGLTGAVAGYAQARDEKVKNQIYEDTLATTDKLQQPYIDALNASGGATIPGVTDGGASAPRTPNSIGGPDDRAQDAAVPAALTAAAGKMSKLQTALGAGTVRDSYYHNQLNSMVKSLRANFPGYNQQIDAIVQNVTGITPANALMTDFFQESAKNAAEKSSEANRWLSFVDTNNQDLIRSGLGDVIAHPDAWASPEKQAQARLAVAQVQAADANTASANASLEMKEKLKNATVDDYNQVYTNEAGTNGSLAINAGMNGDQSVMSDLAKAQAKPGSVPPERISQIQGTLSQMLTQSQSAVNDYLYKPYNEQGQTRAANLKNDATKIAQIKQAWLGPITDAMDAITNEKYGLGTFAARDSKYHLDAQKDAILSRSPYGLRLAAERDLYGDSFIDAQISQGEQAGPGGEYQQFLGDVGTISILSGDSSANEFTSTFGRDALSGAAAPTIIKNVDKAIGYITDSTSPPEATAAAVGYLFGSDNTNFLWNFADKDNPKNKDMTQQTMIYNRMVNPTVTAKVAEAAKSNPMLMTRYAAWATKNFIDLFAQDMNEVNKGFINRKYLDVSWNPDTLQVSVRPTPGNPITKHMQTTQGTVPQFLGLSPVDAVEGLLSSGTVDSINRINAQLSSIKSVIEAAGGNPNIEILKLVHTMGVNPGAPKQGNFADAIGAGIAGFRDYLASSFSRYGSVSSGSAKPDPRNLKVPTSE